MDQVLAEGDVRFSKYQSIPDFVRDKLVGLGGKIVYSPNQIDLDARRFQFLKTVLPREAITVVEIGANLGYFGLSLAHDRPCKYIGYEPLEFCVSAARALAELGDVSSHCEFRNEPVDLKDIQDLPDADLIIELNVLHHAGALFDKDQMQRLGWRAYGLARLKALRERSARLFFQTGNSAGNETLFQSIDAVEFVFDLLSSAGWKVKNVGTIDDLESLEYVSHSYKNRDAARIYACRRDPVSNLVEYRLDGSVVGHLMTGLANRPLWYCE
ncbi:MAG: class I SAM-dependent methyltransferase [Alphaproteobacteria bacterium]|nr:class I SAM-dependent methyltransferase [Alphaproteobacteria bacterium]